MEYSEEVQSILKSNGISVMDRIKLVKEGKTYEGTLMPNTAMSDPICVTIKLDNGYNVGIEYSEDVEIEKIESGTKKEREIKLKQDESKPPISIISTGGTISSKVEYETGAVEPALNAEEIISNVPEITDHVYIRNYVQATQMLSEDIDSSTWVKLAEMVKKELNNGSRGVVITHGTDTMHYTSAALSFMLTELTKPVVLTGAQRSIDRGSSDAAMNLKCAAIAAASDIGEVGIVMHGTMSDDYCNFIRGTKARKMHTSRRDTFRPINDTPIAKIDPNGEIEKLQEHRKYRDEETEIEAEFEEKIAILKAYPESDPEVIDHYEGKKYKGYVLEGTGLGHVPTQAKKSWIPKIKEVIDKGKTVVGTSQCIYGRVNPNVYSNLRKLYHEAGAVSGEDMTTETAYVKLGWLLGTNRDPEKINEDMKGEISDRSKPEEFLY